MARRQRSPQNAGKRTQRTRPKKGKPVEIPVPKRGEVEHLIRKAAKQNKGG